MVASSSIRGTTDNGGHCGVQRADDNDAAPAGSPPPDLATPLLRVRPFRLLFITRVASTTATQMPTVIVGCQVYELTDSSLHLQ